MTRKRWLVAGLILLFVIPLLWAGWRSALGANHLHLALAGLQRLDRVLLLARSALQVAPAAPALLGADGPRTYLLLAQNNEELRATGGFISAVGILRVRDGRIEELQLTDSYAVDDFQQPHSLAPRPLSEYMGAEILLLRDSNWSPDFPASAEVARAIYAQDQGVSTDGAVALDLEAVRLLVGALEPLEVPGIEGQVTADNVLQRMKQAWERPATSDASVSDPTGGDWWLRRKDFMGQLMAAALAKLQSGRHLRPVALLEALSAMLDARHLQIALDDPVASRVLAENGWDGALRPLPGKDFLAVVDSNLGFNKANAAVKLQIDYAASMEDGHPTGTLMLTYTHMAEALPADVPCDRTPRYSDSYAEMVRRCYWDYVRVYVPDGSELLASDGLESVREDAGERNTTAFAGMLSLRPGDSKVLTLRYRLPDEIATAPYTLLVRKQAGTPPWPLRVEAGPCPWKTSLEKDSVFECPSGL